jgi:hypothetical protein
VQEEIKTVEVAMKRLAAIASGQKEPAEPGELKPTEVLGDNALAARRIDNVIAQFLRGRTDSPALADSGSPAAQPVKRAFRIEKAIRNKDHSKIEGSAYWAYDNSFAAWSPDDLIPGEYDVFLRYTGPKSGGKAAVKIGKQTFEVTIPWLSEKGKIEPIPVGTVKITERGTDIRVENKGKHKDASYLWNLQALVLQPVTVPHP